MGCSPSHALIINSSRTTHAEPVCLQPRIYMVSESTLRILQDVGELRLYQQEDKDPGVARVRFGTNTLDQLENPVGYQSQICRQFSIDSEQGVKVSQNDSKIAPVDLETAQENNQSIMEEDSVDYTEQDTKETTGLLSRDDTTSQCSNSSSSTLIVAQIHNPLSLKSLAKESAPNDVNSMRTESPNSRENATSEKSSYTAILPVVP